MFKHLSNHKTILVTGNQRSGTTICARMIAHDTGHTYIDEEDFAVHELVQFRDIIDNQNNIVIHCPAMARYIHEFGRVALIVWMIRPLEEILASQAKIGWLGSKSERTERAKYENGDSKMITAVMKDDYWRNVQRKQCSMWLEIKYKSLRNHELWIDNREGFDKRQWK